MLSYECNRMSAESTRAILCLGEWARLGLLTEDDLEVVTKERVLPEEIDERDSYDEDEWESNRHQYDD